MVLMIPALDSLPHPVAVRIMAIVVFLLLLSLLLWRRGHRG
ncbi:MAG TPA: hypothetical protein VHZ52_14650 [Acidobacteriaceae bacterium]|jgi:hypothetical protein|nr:hypothetical protein [Acidobacteriaceae bacterium]